MFSFCRACHAPTCGERCGAGSSHLTTPRAARTQTDTRWRLTPSGAPATHPLFKSQEGINAIISGGFKVGGRDGIPIANGAAHGNGVYTATGPATPMQSYAGGTSQVILARALPGRQGARDAAGGADMWRPRRDWAVFADAASLLPVYVVRFH